ncbi:MAG: GNAT family N-acetyltransferase [Thermodesulfobacteriota bacterium]|jgi:ribosomal protein S18 acetylase RimI-like enzyme
MTAMISLFREIQSAEVDEAYRIYIEAFDWLKAKGVRQWLVPLSKDKYLDRQQRGENFGLFIGARVGAIVSLAWEVSPYWQKEVGADAYWWLSTLAVATEFRGEKIAEQMVLEAENWLRGKGATEVFVDCVDERGFLPSFYKRLGFDEVCRKSITYPSGNTFPMVLMKKMKLNQRPQLTPSSRRTTTPRG